MNHKERFTRENLRPRALALVRTYYPSPRREKILTCCVRQLGGDDRRTCRDALCPNCCPRESHKIAKTQYQRFRDHTPAHKPGPRLAHEVYTLPPHLHHRIRTNEGFAAWKRATIATIREIHQTDVAGVMNLHPIGDGLTKFHPHWDVVLNGYVLHNGRPKEHRPPRIHYDDARAIYKRHLVRELKLTPDWEPREVNLFLDRARGTYWTQPRKTWHMVRYSAHHVYQPQFAWLNDHGTRGDWWYRPTKNGQSTTYEGPRGSSVRGARTRTSPPPRIPRRTSPRRGAPSPNPISRGLTSFSTRTCPNGLVDRWRSEPQGDEPLG